jgi:hypothetical protein
MVMLSRMVLRTLAMCGIPLAALLLMPVATQAQDCDHCPRWHCPPGLKHCFEGAPHIHFRRGCPKPICNPCLNPNWGYFETCWNPWPWAPDFSHCRTPPPAATIILNPGGTAIVPQSLSVPERTVPPPPSAPVLPSPRSLRPGL